MKRLLYLVPLCLVTAIVFVFVRDLNGSTPDTWTSSFIDEPAPQTDLPPLDGAAKGFKARDLKAGHVSVLTIWASWCAPCRAETPALVQLARLKGVSLYGIVYEDRPSSARQFLHDAGDPFSRIDIDPDGRAAKAWGIAGVPETFVIDGNGIVRLRYGGPIVGSALDQFILPAIARARSNA